MRMWMVDPRILCQKHLCGEHLEMHMYLGALRCSHTLTGFLKNNLFEPKKLFERHNELAKEMLNRGYKHKSDMCEQEVLTCLDNLCEIEKNIIINKEKSLIDLLGRCPKCEERLMMIKGEKI